MGHALFADHDRGAVHWGVIASLIETCKLNAVDPEAYLARVLTRLKANVFRLFPKEQLPFALYEMFNLEGKEPSTSNSKPRKLPMPTTSNNEEVTSKVSDSNFDNISFDHVNLNGGAFNLGGAQDVDSHFGDRFGGHGEGVDGHFGGHEEVTSKISDSNFDNISFHHFNTNGGAFNLGGAQEVDSHFGGQEYHHEYHAHH